jgi:hypothetical protein
MEGLDEYDDVALVLLVFDTTNYGLLSFVLFKIFGVLVGDFPDFFYIIDGILVLLL